MDRGLSLTQKRKHHQVIRDQSSHQSSHPIWMQEFFYLALSDYFYGRDLLSLSFVSPNLRQCVNWYITLRRENLKRMLLIKFAMTSPTYRVFRLRSQLSLNNVAYNMPVFFTEFVRSHFRSKLKLSSNKFDTCMPFMDSLMDYMLTYPGWKLQIPSLVNFRLARSLISWLDLLYFNLNSQQLIRYRAMIDKVISLAPLYGVSCQYEGRFYPKVIYLFRNQFAYCSMDNMMRYAIDLLNLKKYFASTVKLNLDLNQIHDLFLFGLNNRSSVRQKYAHEFFTVLLQNLNEFGLHGLLLNLIRYVTTDYFEPFIQYCHQKKIHFNSNLVSQLFIHSFSTANEYKHAKPARLKALIEWLSVNQWLSIKNPQDNEFWVNLAIKNELCIMVRVLLSARKNSASQRILVSQEVYEILVSDDFIAGLPSRLKRQQFKRWAQDQLISPADLERDNVNAAVNGLLSLK